MLRIFLGSFGLPRALPYTIDSIERNIYSRFDKKGFSVVRAAHFNNPDIIASPRSGEHEVAFDIGDLSRMRLDFVEIEAQDSKKFENTLNTVLKFPYLNEDDAGGHTRRNSLYQLYSLRRLLDIYNRFDKNSFDAVFLFRPDLAYLDPLPLHQMLDQIKMKNRSPSSILVESCRFLRRHRVAEADIVTPWWHQYGGLNDRFAFLTPEAAVVYMNRIEDVEDFCECRRHYHSESLLKFSIERAGMSAAKTWVRAQRIRSDGSVASRDIPTVKRRIYYKVVYPFRQIFQI